MVFIATILSSLLVGLAAGESYIHPTVPAGSGLPSKIRCDSIGDCWTANVKWGHPSPNNYGRSGFAQDIPADARSGISTVLTQAAKNAKSRASNETVPRDSAEDGSLILTLESFDPQNVITWEDAYQYWTILNNSADQISYTIRGIIWAQNNASVKVGAWELTLPVNDP